MGVRRWFDTTIDSLDHDRIRSELTAAGLSIEGTAWNSNPSRVGLDFVEEPTEQDLLEAQAIIDAHDGTDFDAIVKAGAKAEFANIPDWAAWDRATFNTWFDANVTTAADALPVLKRAIWAIIALRNEIYPDIQD